MNSDQIKLAELIRRHALEYGDFTLKSGAKSHFYLDLRKLHLTPEGLLWVCHLLWQKMQPLAFEAFGGPSIGADPIIGGLTYLAGMHPGSHRFRGFLIRKESKDHGIAGRIVGPLQPGSRCVIVEDVVTSGGSSLEAIEAVEAFGAKVVKVFAVVDRLAGGAERFAERGYQYEALLTIDNLRIESNATKESH